MRKQFEINATPALPRQAHRRLYQRAVRSLGYLEVAAAGFLRVTTSAVNRATWTDSSAKLDECRQDVPAPTSPITRAPRTPTGPSRSRIVLCRA